MLLILIAAGFLIYSSTYSNPFVFDDFIAITKNPNIRMSQFSLEGLQAATVDKTYGNRPLAMISFALNYYIHRYDVWGYHFVNILLHVLTGTAFYFFCKQTLVIVNRKKLRDVPTDVRSSMAISFGAAFLWLVHPVQTQSVNYIIQRMNSMAAFFFVVSILFYIHARQARKRKTFLFAGCFLAGLLAMGSKENAATLPGFILVYEWYFFQDLSKKWLKRNAVVFAGLVVFAAAITLIYYDGKPIQKISEKYATKEFNLEQKVLTEFRVVIHYIGLFLFPHPSRLNLDYDFSLSTSLVQPHQTLASLLTIVAFLVTACLLAKKERVLSFCILWYFGNLVIESTFVPVDLIYEHRLYLPSMALSLSLAVIGYRVFRSQWLRLGVFAVLVVTLSTWTITRNRVWQSEETLWRDCVKKAPSKARPYINLGDVLEKQGRPEEAVQYYAKALEIKPDSVAANLNMGSALFSSGKLEQAVSFFHKTLELKPDDAQANNNLGLALVRKGMIADAIPYFNRAVRIAPRYSDAKRNLYLAVSILHQLDAAVEKHLSAMQRIEQKDLQEAFSRLNQSKKEVNDAISRYMSALSRQRGHTGFDIDRLECIQKVNETYEHLLPVFFRISAERPEIADGHYHAACILFRYHRKDEALDELKKAREKGFSDMSLLKVDRDLDGFRDETELQSWITESADER